MKLGVSHVRGMVSNRHIVSNSGRAANSVQTAEAGQDCRMPQIFYPIVFMNFLFAMSAWCLARPTRVSATATAVAAIVWLFGCGRLEGHVLWEVNETHGLTVSDFLSLAGLMVAAWGFRVTRRAPRRRHASSRTSSSVRLR